ncbi:DUF5320 domain-containing protein [Formosa sediminum]|uniref:DUF5320 domain-containing protein n=1 Tax=Formosa sediminum TaxID=2594004 RepID=UPI00163D3D80|nr:DUF5320 domain-containing protein [Formosa sediminum]
MPSLDGTGPEGLGTKTGMQLGLCKKGISDGQSVSGHRPYCQGRRKKLNTDKIVRLKS